VTTQANANSKTKSIGKFLKGVKSELKKVNWPNREELINHTGIVIITCIVVALTLWVLDVVFGYGLNLIIK
jgi:preprotein translocase subunit SecE